MTCPRSTRFNTATKICESKRAVPCPASGSKPMPSVAPAGVINGGGENGFANSEWREHFRSSIFTSWVLSSCELVLVTSPLDEDMISVCLFLHRRCPSNCTNLLVFPVMLLGHNTNIVVYYIFHSSFSQGILVVSKRLDLYCRTRRTPTATRSSFARPRRPSSKSVPMG